MKRRASTRSSKAAPSPPPSPKVSSAKKSTLRKSTPPKRASKLACDSEHPNIPEPRLNTPEDKFPEVPTLQQPTLPDALQKEVAAELEEGSKGSEELNEEDHLADHPIPLIDK